MSLNKRHKMVLRYYKSHGPSIRGEECPCPDQEQEWNELIDWGLLLREERNGVRGIGISEDGERELD